MSPGLAATELLGIMMLAVMTFLASLAVLAWAFPLEDVDDKLPRSKGETRYKKVGEKLDLKRMRRNSSASGSNASRCSSSPSIRSIGHRPLEIQDLQVMEELEQRKLDLRWTSLEQEDTDVSVCSPTYFREEAQTTLSSALREKKVYAQQGGA